MSNIVYDSMGSLRSRFACWDPEKNTALSLQDTHFTQTLQIPPMMCLFLQFKGTWNRHIISLQKQKVDLPGREPSTKVTS